MIYIAENATSILPATAPFTKRDLNGLTVGKMSNLILFGKPREPQLAYAGYRQNIETFCFATATGKKVLVGNEGLPFPESFAVTLTLPFPQVIFKVKVKTTSAQVDKIKGKLQGVVESVQNAKNDAILTVNKNTIANMRTINQIATPYTMKIDSYAQVKSLTTFIPVYQFVEAFLATNQYPYKKADNGKTQATNYKMNYLFEHRTDVTKWRAGYGDGKLQKVDRGGDVSMEKRKVDTAEDDDLTPHYDSTVDLYDSVTVAKPAATKASSNYGLPKSVPNKGGLLFPYFAGMLSQDTKQLRGLVGELIFRNLGKDPKAAWKEFKEEVGLVANTPEGIVMTHILKGVSLALETQTQLYLLVDKKDYMGFVLLGEEFDIFFGNKWYAPLTAPELLKELSAIMTSDRALSKLSSLMSGLNITKDDGMPWLITADDIDTPMKLAQALGEAAPTVGEEANEAVRGQMEELVKQISFPGDYLTFKPKDIAESIRLLTCDDAIPGERYIYIPSSGWSSCLRRDYQVFAAFGSRSFSLFAEQGDEIQFSKIEEYFKETVEAGNKRKRAHGRFSVQEVTLAAAMTKWQNMIASEMMRMDFTRRESSVKNHVFTIDSMGPIVNAMVDAFKAGKLVTSAKEERVKKAIAAVPTGFNLDSILDSM